MNLDLKIRNWIKINAALNTNVVIPMLIFVINAKEYEIELIGVVPRVDTIEKATPSDITNNPTVNKQILLSMILDISNIFFKLTESVTLIETDKTKSTSKVLLY